MLASALSVAIGCSGSGNTTGEETPLRASASAIVASLRTQSALAWPSAAVNWVRQNEVLRPTFAPRAFLAAGGDQLVVDVPTRADGPVRMSWRALPDFWIELVPEGVGAVAGEVVDAAVVFPGAAKDTDLVQVARPSSLEELRVLRTADAARTLRWSIRKGPGVASVRLEEDGSIVATHVGGSARFVAPRPFAIDAVSADVPLRTRVDDGAAVTKLEIDVDVRAARFPVVVDPQWATTATMTLPRIQHQATLLDDGRVLVTGGSTYVNAPAYSASEIYDETKGTFTAGPNMAVPRTGHTATLLLDGKVLVAGGYRNDPAQYTYLSSVELFDPATNTFSAGPALPAVRGDHAAVRTKSGRVALVGGRSANATLYNNGVEYNPATKLWRTSISGSMQAARYWPAATLLSDTTVMVGGGQVAVGYSNLVDVFSPEYSMAAFWSNGKPMSQQRVGFELATTAAGDVLAVGGGNLPAAEIFRKATMTWEAAGAPSTIHGRSTSTVLDDGRILVVGGGTAADVYDPLAAGPTTAWKTAGNLSAPRANHRAVKLKSGRVLIVGGYNPPDQKPLSTAELFTTLPQGSACTDAGECVSGFCVDGYCCDKACNGQCEACDLAKKGTCDNVAGPPHGTRMACGGAAACVDDVAIGAPVCNGSGSCAAPLPVSCLPFKCNAGACATSCKSNADCSGANVCFEGSCAARLGVCSADRGSTTLSGQTTPTSCGAYLCREEDGTCGKSCTATGDCASGYACDTATSKCVATSSGGDSSDGGCAMGSPGGNAAAGLVGLCIALSALARRRR